MTPQQPSISETALAVWGTCFRSWHYDIVYIHLGSNDLCSSDNVSIWLRTSPDICYIVGAYDRSLFLSCCCAGVMTATKCRSHSLTITELWFIAGPRQISATLLGRTTGRYFWVVVALWSNDRYRCGSSLDGVGFWLHRRLQNSSWFSNDGVHLNRRGEQRFIRTDLVCQCMASIEQIRCLPVLNAGVKIWIKW